MEYNFYKIGENIRNMRKSKGISQEKLIEELKEKHNCSISRNTLSKIEGGNGEKPSFTFDFLFAFANMFDCDIGYLLGEYDEKKQETHQICSATGLNEKAVETLNTFNGFGIGSYIDLPVDKGKTTKGQVISEYDKPIYIVNLLLENSWIIGLILSYLTMMNDEKNAIYSGDKANTILFEIMCQLRKLRELYHPIYEKEFKKFYDRGADNGKHTGKTE